MRVSVWLLLLVFLVTASAASADEVDTPAIASMFSIGLADAQSDFASLRGPRAKQNPHTVSYRAVQEPTGDAFASCFVFSVLQPPSTDPGAWAYSCNSTRRAATPEELFVEIEPLVRESLPIGYSSSGILKTVPYGDMTSEPWENWTRAGSPTIILQVFADAGNESHYVLGMRRDRAGQ
jgi:hypothetical protein